MSENRSFLSRRRLLGVCGLSLFTAGAPMGGVAAAAGRRTAGRAREPQRYVHAGPKALALTIDDGPDPVWTPQVLSLLSRYGVPATFFLIGSRAEAHPDVVRRIVAGGHLLGNHTWSHPDLGELPAARVREEMERTGEVIARTTGEQPPELFRAPGGNFTHEALAVCDELGLWPVSWSVDPQDWARPGTDRIVERVLAQTRSGSIILNHDGGGDRSQTVAALRIYLPRLMAAGYWFTVPGPRG
ncbi:polysaccharide deacetylase family protein [Streptomyces sp. NPDC003077]|uniref:polysaccharide deacetylase family protein n=1 Tax=Streptomyces sp. NPDC003077 TaxID=3154443 RepID=UPI0033A83987